MNTENNSIGRRDRVKALLLHLLCVAAVLTAALLVRTAPLSFSGDDEKTRAAFTDENGLPYLTDMDSYYHVRLVDNYLVRGTLGDSISEDGRDWDSRSFAPEGRSAAYQPGIILITAAVQKLSGFSLDSLEYRIAAFVSALSAAVAYWIAFRMSNRFGGLTGGLLVGCAPAFVARTCFGRFDTDLFVVLMELLLILLLTEMLRASSRRPRILLAAGFALCAVLYSFCWTPTYAMLFAGLTLAGGLLFSFAALFYSSERRSGAAGFFRQPEFCALLLAVGLTVPGLLLTYGPSVFLRIFSALSFSTTSSVSEGALPNLLESISELNSSELFPEKFLQAFTGHVPGKAPSVVNGVGGAAAFFLSLAGLVWLFLNAFPRYRKGKKTLPAKVSAMYCCILGAWLAAGLYLTGFGVRFIEHLSIPTGLLAGCFVGQCFTGVEKGIRKAVVNPFPVKKACIALLLFAAAVIPALSGAAASAAAIRPSVSDASVKAMRYIKENAGDPDAVIASWWDMGYFYEAASGHPCLWDGGTQNGIRALQISKALTTDSLELSRRILLMLSTSGNSAVNLLLQHTDTKTAFHSLWKALMMKKEKALALLESSCNLSTAEAEEVWSKMRPEETRETYLILTYTMTRQIGWYEHYAEWDFTGSQPLPATSLFSYTPEGTPLFRTEEGQDYLEQVRGREAIWRLFFNGEKTPCFTPAFEWHDGLEHVRIWRVAA